MYEKISEEETRQEKVKKVKNKILSEIDNRICSYKKLFAINEKTTEEDYNFFISENFALLELKKYLKKDNCFMSYEAKYLDIVEVVQKHPENRKPYHSVKINLKKNTTLYLNITGGYEKPIGTAHVFLLRGAISSEAKQLSSTVSVTIREGNGQQVLS